MRAVPVAATMGVVKLTVSGLELKVDDRHARTPLLWVLRGRRFRARARDVSASAYVQSTTEPAPATELIGNALIVPEVETSLSNMEAELRSHEPDVCYVYLSPVAARRPDDEEGTHGGDGTV
jgi:hypothetical protein